VEVVLAGASGLIGTALRDALRAGGHRVKVLVRHETSAADTDSWDPAAGRVDPDFLASADAVVCLSGVTVGKRWTESYKQLIEQSRVDSVATLARSLKEYGGPRTLVCASAVGYYGDTGDRLVEEDAPAGSSFLAGVCRKWEAAADPARDAGVRVAHLRTGLVLADDSDLMRRLKPLVLLGVAGRLGDGRQYFPWITLQDEIRAIMFVLTHDLAGPVNLTAPAPVTNAEFTKAIGRVLHRPTVFAAPAFGVRLLLGEFAGEVLGGQRAVPAALTAAGFEFDHTEVEAGLHWALNR
jgi:hypothetical protein